MTADEIGVAVAAFHAEELRKAQVRMFDRPAWRDPEYADTQMAEVEARTAAYAQSLGDPDADAAAS